MHISKNHWAFRQIGEVYQIWVGPVNFDLINPISIIKVYFDDRYTGDSWWKIVKGIISYNPTLYGFYFKD